MPMKEWLRNIQPVQLYVMLTLTILFFLTELIVSHLTHALILLMDSYHMLCNIFALTGCIITIKYGSQIDSHETSTPKSLSIDELKLTSDTTCHDKEIKKTSPARTKQERKLKNTFGWTRIDVITMLICCVFLASFSFSVYVEALQTLAHIDHLDAMHHPISVLCIGAAGLLLNGVCYLLIGGYTFHQGSFLYVTESGDVILNKIVVNDSVQKGGRRLSRTRNIYSTPPKKRQGLWEMTRDIIGCTLVMICSIIVIFTEPQVAKFIDPIMSLISATCIMTLSYPYIKESCMILLQTMPDTINIDSMKKELINHFPDIVNVHDFHIWQLTASKVISTVHIIFENPKVYQQIMEEVKEFFLENGVTQVTIQPEFSRSSSSLESLTKLPPVCLVACQGEDCKLNHCCPSYEDVSIFKHPSKEVIPTPEHATPTLKSVRYMDDELPSLGHSVSSYSLSSIESSEHGKSNNELCKHVEENTIQEEEMDDKTAEVINANSGDDDTSKSSTDDLISEKNERDTVDLSSEIQAIDINTASTET